MSALSKASSIAIAKSVRIVPLFCDVSDECVKRETETCSGELVQSD